MLVDVIALVFGILLTMRKLNVAKRRAEDYPGIDPAQFERWKALEGGAYTLGSAACFLKILVDYAFRFWASRSALDWSTVRIIGGSIFAAWVIALMFSAVRGASGRRLREELGITLREEPPPA